jgi:hypothetical protein
MSIEQRLTDLERKANRFRNAFVLTVLTLAGVVLLGATTDDVQDVVRTKRLEVLNEAGDIAILADGNGDGLLTVNSKAGKNLIHAGSSEDGNGLLKVSSKTGKNLIYAGGSEDGASHLDPHRPPELVSFRDPLGMRLSGTSAQHKDMDVDR